MIFAREGDNISINHQESACYAIHRYAGNEVGVCVRGLPQAGDCDGAQDASDVQHITSLNDIEKRRVVF